MAKVKHRDMGIIVTNELIERRLVVEGLTVSLQYSVA